MGYAMKPRRRRRLKIDCSDTHWTLAAAILAVHSIVFILSAGGKGKLICHTCCLAA